MRTFYERYLMQELNRKSLFNLYFDKFCLFRSFTKYFKILIGLECAFVFLEANTVKKPIFLSYSITVLGLDMSTVQLQRIYRHCNLFPLLYLKR